MPVFWNALIIVFVLLLLGAWVLFIHHLSPHISLFPHIFLLGGLTAALQFGSLGTFQMHLTNLEVSLSLGSYILLPALLLGILVIYIINGSTKARLVILGLAFTSLMVASFQLLPPLYQNSPRQIVTSANPEILSARIPFASTLTLPVDLILLVVIYQIISNLRRRFPSRMASGIALMVALWCDALLFSTVAYAGTLDWSSQLLTNLIGKSLTGVIIWPLAFLYVGNTPKRFPDSAVSVPRPALDLFSTQLQLEARSRYHYSLLRTISQVNQAILRASQPQALLEEACQLLVEGRDYSLAWIGLLEEPSLTVRPVAKAGQSAHQLELVFAQEKLEPKEQSPIVTVLHTRRPVVLQGSSLNRQDVSWQKTAWESGVRTCAAFPMCHDDHIIGVLSVYDNRPEAFGNAEEIDLLDELANDLAHALKNLEVRHQQAFLSTAAETMRDGLLIINLRGAIIYANLAVAEMLGCDILELKQSSILSFMSPEHIQAIRSEFWPALRKEGSFTTEVEIPTSKGQTIFSVKGALVRNVSGRAVNVVISVRDVTSSRVYERRLITLNRIATELVQIRDPQELFQAILGASEELLQADASALYLVDENFHQITDYYHHKLPDEHVAQIENFSRNLPSDISALFVRSTCVDDITVTPHYRESLNLIAVEGLYALMTIPVFYQGQTLGVLVLYYQKPHVFDDTEKQLGLTVTNNLAIALQNARLYQAEHSQRQLAEALAQATTVLNSTLELDKVLDHILEQTISVVPCRSVNLMLIEGEYAKVVRQLHRSSSGEIHSYSTGPSLPLSLPTLQHVLENAQPLLIADTVRDTMWRSLQATTWIRSYATAPLQIRQEIIGFLNVNSDKPNFFSQETTHRLQAFASNAAAALHNAHLYQELQGYTQELEDRVHERTIALSAAKDRIEGILASVPDAVFVIDQNSHLLEANQAGAALLLQAGQQQIDLFTPAFLEPLKNGTIPNENAVLEVCGRAYQALASPLSASNDQTGLVIVFRDVTRFRELDQMKTQFVSDVSHELRTPLTSLSLYLDLLADERDEQRRQRFQATLRRETDRLTQLIEDLLTISRLESNRLFLHIQGIDVDTLVSELVQDRTPMAARRNLTLGYVRSPELPLTCADPRLLTQVVSNLLTNAMNYTPVNGKIMLSTSLQQADTGKWIVISITDTGVGISPKELPHIFERFFRGSAGRQTGAPGTGLGLAISREITERMGGYITMQSECDKGSTFSIWLQAMP